MPASANRRSCANCARRWYPRADSSPPAKVDLDLGRLVLQVCELMSDELRANAISLKTELPGEIPLVRADPVQIQQVLTNLLRNAIEASVPATGQKTPILIRIRSNGAEFVCEVQDRGTGLDDRANIFEPFVTTKETGMGMGLAICQSIIEAHGGRIWVVRNQTAGVTFSFTLPASSSGES